MLVDTIGSIDDLIENLGNQRNQINILISTLLTEFKATCLLKDYHPNIVKPGLNHFGNEKTYLDTSCIDGTFVTDFSYCVSENNRPSRANMQPVTNTVWTARMAQSFKVIAITDFDKTLIENCLLSTGFIGICGTENFPCSFLYAVFISEPFRKIKDQLSTGSTISAINNKEFLNLPVPLLSSDEMHSFDTKVKPLINKLSVIREKEINLRRLKRHLLSKFFDF